MALQNTENGLLNAEFVDFRFLLGFFMAHYAHFKFRAFLWLTTLIFCVARLLPYPVILSEAKYPQNQSVDSSPAAQNDKAQNDNSGVDFSLVSLRSK